MGQSKESIITDKGETTILNVQCALDTLALIFDKAGDVAPIRFDGGHLQGVAYILKTLAMDLSEHAYGEIYPCSKDGEGAQ